MTKLLMSSQIIQTQQRFKTYGNLQDKDRIFTNLYKDGDPFIEGALKRGDWH